MTSAGVRGQKASRLAIRQSTDEAMTLSLYNTLAREKQVFEPIDANSVGMYVCGPTVYDYAHIGNARPAVVFDVLFRLLRRRYGPEHVTYVRNITDVDDKIINAHKETGEPIDEITARTARAYWDDMHALGCLDPDIEPRATRHIDEMVAMIGTLIDGGHAYAADGHVLFDVPSMPEYGALSRRNIDEMIAGARVEVAPYKRNPQDFVLWKPSVGDEPGWDSPWGRGRPGWHIECSAMSGRYLGETFDIHGGGQDLIFPHHENEIAQSRCAHGGLSVRPLLGSQRLPDDRGREDVEEPRQLLHRPRPVEGIPGRSDPPGAAADPLPPAARLHQGRYRPGPPYPRPVLLGAARQRRGRGCRKRMVEASAAVEQALADDINTPAALAHLHDALGALNKAEQPEDIARHKAALLAGGKLLGLLRGDPEEWLHWRPEGRRNTSRSGDQNG